MKTYGISVVDSGLDSEVKDYIALTKPGVLSLVLFSALTGMFLAPGKINPIIALISLLSISFGSAAAAVINMWYDRDIDKIMIRTQNRPIPSGKISPDNALSFGILLGFLSVLIMFVCVNHISAVLLLFSILFYVVIYTVWLKRSTPQNIVIGGLSGSLPPIIGWTCVTGEVDLLPILLFLIIFFWTPAHFWALALKKSDDYKLAKIPMMPITHGHYYTKIQILIYAVLTFLISIMPYVFGYSGLLFVAVAIVLGIKFIVLSYKLLKDQENSSAMKLFKFSILYLFTILFAIMVDKV